MCEMREIFYFRDSIVTDIKRGDFCLVKCDRILACHQNKVDRGHERYAQGSLSVQRRCGSDTVPPDFRAHRGFRLF